MIKFEIFVQISNRYRFWYFFVDTVGTLPEKNNGNSQWYCEFSFTTFYIFTLVSLLIINNASMPTNSASIDSSEVASRLDISTRRTFAILFWKPPQSTHLSHINLFPNIMELDHSRVVLIIGWVDHRPLYRPMCHLKVTITVMIQIGGRGRHLIARSLQNTLVLSVGIVPMHGGRRGASIVVSVVVGSRRPIVVATVVPPVKRTRRGVLVSL